MKVLTEKKINKWIVIAALYLALCFAYFVPMRGTVALMAYNYGLSGLLDNDVVSFIFAGVFPTLIYELLTSAIFRFEQARGLKAADDMRYALRFFYFAAGVAMGGVKLIFMFYPLYSTLAFPLIDVGVPLIAFIFFMWFALKTYVDKTRYAKTIYELGGTFVIVYGVLTLVELLTGVVA